MYITKGNTAGIESPSVLKYSKSFASGAPIKFSKKVLCTKITLMRPSGYKQHGDWCLGKNLVSTSLVHRSEGKWYEFVTFKIQGHVTKTGKNNLPTWHRQEYLRECLLISRVSRMHHFDCRRIHQRMIKML